MFGLVRTTPPTVEPITLDEAKAHLKVVGDDEDAIIALRLQAAREHVEDEWVGRALLQQTWRLTLDGFPTCGAIELPRAPLISVGSVQYIDLDGTLQTWSAAAYTVRTDTEPGTIAPIYGGTWPYTRAELGAVRVLFTAGYGAAASAVPSPIRAAILLALSDLHEIHEETLVGVTAQTRKALDRLLAPYTFRWTEPK